MWSASARHAYDALQAQALASEVELARSHHAYNEMEARALVAEEKLAELQKSRDVMEVRALAAEAKLTKARSSMNEGIEANVTSHDTLSWNTAMMTVLNDMLEEASASLEPDRIFEVATRTICQYLNASSVYICYWNQQDKTTTVLADYFGDKASQKERFSDVGYVYQLDDEFERRLTQEAYWISNHQDHSLTITEALQYDTYDVKVSIYVPMYAGNQIIGYVEAWDTSAERSFTKQQIDFLLYITRQIAGNVRIAQLYRALSQSEGRYRILMNSIEGGVAQVDMMGNIQFVNRHFSSMVNMPIKEIINQNLEQLWAQKASPTEIEEEYRLEDREGNPMWVQVVHAPIPGDTGNIIGEAVIYSDITRRKESEQWQIRMALENERINLLAGFIKDTAHEFYTPISIINTRLFLIRKKYDDAQLHKDLEIIETQADSITNLIKTLAEMTKLDAMDTVVRENYNISLLVEQIVTKYRPIAEASQKILHFEADNDRATLDVDVTRLNMALDEIIGNALDYTSEHGTITVRVREQEGNIELIIQDTGIGMTEESQQRAFERFYRADTARSTRGFGLGLSIAKRVIDLHEGTISIKSEEGIGATFTIKLPSHQDK